MKNSALILSLGMAVASIPIDVWACSVDVADTGTGQHYLYEAECPSRDAALAGCASIALAHGYAARYCSYTEQGSGSTLEGSVWGGWFSEQNGVEKTPYHAWKAVYGYSLLRQRKNMEKDNCDPATCEVKFFGDPINAGTGNKFETHTEYVSAGAFPLQVTWTYNSMLAASYVDKRTQVFGQKRSHYYGRSILAVRASSTWVLWAYRPGGGALRFTPQGDHWAAEPGIAARVREVKVGETLAGWVLEAEDGLVETYSKDGLLVQLRDRSGRTHTLAYTSGSQLSSVTDDQGRMLTFEYTPAGVSGIATPEGTRVAFLYTSGGDLAEVIYPDTSRVQYRYNESGFATSSQASLLTGVIDETGVRSSSTWYDSYGRAIGTALGNGVATTSATYTSANRPLTATITLENGDRRVVKFTTASGVAVPVTSTTSCTGCATDELSFTYDALGHVDVVTRNGVVTDHDYDDWGRLLKVVEAANDPSAKRTELTAWHPTHPFPTERRRLDANGALVSLQEWTYNERGQELSHTRSDPATGATRTVTTTYCEQGDVDAGTCPLVGLLRSTDGSRATVADLTTYQYYAADHPSCATAPTTCPWRKGDLWKVTNAAGQITEFLRYDGAGRVLSSRDTNGVITDFNYDLRGRLLSRTTRAAN